MKSFARIEPIIDLSAETNKTSLRKFIAVASDELKTQLTALKAVNALLSDRVKPQDEVQTTFAKQSGNQIALLDH